MSRGIKISLPQKDVQTCSPLECSLHSDYTAFKSRVIGVVALPANSWVEVAHNFGYAPAYSIWTSKTTNNVSGITLAGYLGLPEDDGSLESYVTTSSLFLRSSKSCTAYYYLYADDAGTISSHVPIPDYGEYGLIISRAGVDVTTAKPYQLNFLSTYPNFKVMSKKYGEGLAISKISQNNPDIGSSGENLTWNNAGSFGMRGIAVISGYRQVGSGQGWNWVSSLDLGNGQVTIVDNLLSQGWIKFFLGDSSSGFFTASLINNQWVAEGGPFDRQVMSEDNGWHIEQSGGVRAWIKSSGEQWATFWPRFANNDTGEVMGVWWYEIGGGLTYEYDEEFFSFTGITNDRFTGVSRGIWGSSAKDWRDAIEVFIAPVVSIKPIGTTGVNYNPCYFAWAISPYELGGAMGLPFCDGTTAIETLISGQNIYAIYRRRWQSENDEWRTGSAPFVTSGVYLKLMYDEIGT